MLIEYIIHRILNDLIIYLLKNDLSSRKKTSSLLLIAHAKSKYTFLIKYSMYNSKQDSYTPTVAS